MPAPGDAAIVADDGTATFAELDERAHRRARELAAAGVGPGDRVRVTHPPGLAFAELLHALPRLGAVLAPGPPADPPQPAAGGATRDAELLGAFDPDAVHTLIETSGTTGVAKQVELTYANHAASARASADALGVEQGDRWLCPLPLHHVGGLNVLIRSAINATTVVVHDRFDAGRVRDALEAGEATLASLVPTMLSRLRDAGLRSAPGLRRSPWRRPRARGPAGLGERDGHSRRARIRDDRDLLAGRRGQPGPPAGGVELEVAPDGEILVRGPMVAPAAPAADGWLHTGDLGRLDADGRLQVLGQAQGADRQRRRERGAARGRARRCSLTPRSSRPAWPAYRTRSGGRR